MAFLLHVLLTALAIGALHVGLSWGRPLPILRFCAAVSAAHVAIGLAVWLPVLARQAGRSWTTAWWAPVFALGLFATGALLAAAWLGAVRGLELLIRRRLAHRG